MGSVGSSALIFGEYNTKFLKMLRLLCTCTYFAQLCPLAKYENDFWGTLPQGVLSAMTSLVAMGLYDNDFHGPLPTEVGEMTAT